MSNTVSNTVRPINETIREALQDSGYGSYISYAGPVIEALQQRERELSSLLIDYAVDAGADETEVRAYLREIGMVVAEPQSEPEDQRLESDEDSMTEDVLTSLDAKINSIAEMVNSLAQFARSNGFRG